MTETDQEGCTDSDESKTRELPDGKLNEDGETIDRSRDVPSEQDLPAREPDLGPKELAAAGMPENFSPGSANPPGAYAATGGPSFKDQVRSASVAFDLEKTPDKPAAAVPQQTAARRLPEYKDQVRDVRATPAPTAALSSQSVSNADSTTTNSAGGTRVILQADLVESQDDVRQRFFNDAVSAVVVNPRKRWYTLLLVMCVTAIVAGVTASLVTRNQQQQQPSNTVDSTPIPPLNVPTVAPTTLAERPPADVVFQLRVAEPGERNGEILLDPLFDGAVIDVDEVGTDQFTVVAVTSDLVAMVVFDLDKGEKSRPFSRCGDIDRRSEFRPCEDLTEPGDKTVWVIPYPQLKRQGIPWPKESVSFKIIGLLG